MSLARLGLWLSARTALLIAAAPLWAQSPAPYYYPYGQAPDGGQALQPGDPSYSDIVAENSGPHYLAEPDYSPDRLQKMFTPHVHEGFFVQYDGLYWSITQPDATVIGDPDSEHLVLLNSVPYLVENTATARWDDADFDWGHRVDFGHVENGRGWSASVLYVESGQSFISGGATLALDDPRGLLFGYQDSNDDGFDDDIDGDGIFGRSGEDLGTPNRTPPPNFIDPLDGIPDTAAEADLDDLVEYLATFDSLKVKNSVTVAGVELTSLRRSPMSPRGMAHEFSWGWRYLKLDDSFQAAGSSGSLGISNWDACVKNHIFGPQVGARWVCDRGAWKLAAEGRFLAGVNFQDAQLTGLVGGATGDGANQPMNLSATSFRESRSQTEFSPLGEVRLETAYKVSECIALRLGYTGLFLAGVSRAAPKVRYTLPAFEMTDASSSESVIASALHVGVEINR